MIFNQGESQEEQKDKQQDKETSTVYVNNYHDWAPKIDKHTKLSALECFHLGIEHVPGEYQKTTENKDYELIAELVKARQRKYADYIAIGKEKEALIKAKQMQMDDDGFNVHEAKAKNPAFKKAMDIMMGRKDPKKQGPADPKKMAKFLEDMKNGFENNKGE